MTEKYDAEIPDSGQDEGPPTAMPEATSPAQSEEKAEGSFVDASIGHQADKPAVEGDPDDEPQPYDGPPPPADIE